MLIFPSWFNIFDYYCLSYIKTEFSIKDFSEALLKNYQRNQYNWGKSEEVRIFQERMVSREIGQCGYNFDLKFCY